MARQGDDRKRKDWEQRLARFVSSGLTVGRFCQNEKVATHTFYYWARRIRRATPQAHAVRRQRLPVEAPEARESAGSDVVCFRFDNGVAVSLPAHCLDAIRCLADALCQSRPAGTQAFQQVFVRQR
jgi:hypothetical protein